MTSLGRSASRSDGPAKVSGRARYAADLALPGMLHAVVVPSPVAAGTIRSIDVTAAAAIDGVRGIVTGADAPSHPTGLVVWDRPLFAVNEVRHQGEPLAAVAADTIEIARAAAALISVDIDPIDPVVELDDAVTDDARLVHPEWASYYSTDESLPRGGNVAAESVAEPDVDLDAVFADAAHVVTGEYRVERQYQGYLEPRGVIAEFESGRYVLHVSHQHPFALRDRFADAFGVRTSDVRVVGCHIGGGFGAKLELGPEPYAALLACRTGRPVRLIQSRREDLLTCESRENAIMRVSSAVDDDGSILGRTVDVLLDSGAYAGETPVLCSLPLFMTGAPYRVGAARVRTRAVYTNTVPTGPFRGVNGAGMTFALERHMDEIAEVTGIDRRDVRLRNLIGDGDEMLNGQRLDDGSIVREAFEAVSAVAPWPATGTRRNQAGEGRDTVRGVGLAALVWLTNRLPGGASLKLGEDGTLSVGVGATDNGSGAVVQGLRQIAAEEFGLEPDDVLTTLPDTDLHPWDGGSQGSRTTHVVGRAVHEASIELRQKIFDLVATEMEVAVEDLELVEGTVGVRGVPGSRVTLAQVAAWSRSRGGSLLGSGSYGIPLAGYNASCASGLLLRTFGSPTYHVHFAEVEVDTVTGVVTVVRYVVAQEVGRAINPAAVRGQIQGAVTQGIGYALHEGIEIDAAGGYRQQTLEAYRLPIAPDVPRVEQILLEHPDPTGPFGAKGVGEPPLIPVAAAIANAVSDALGVHVNRLPLRPDRVLDLLHDPRLSTALRESTTSTLTPGED